MEKNPVVILCPMDGECDLLISSLTEKEEIKIGGYLFFEGKLGGRPVVVVRCLIGMVNAAVCTTLAVERYSPRAVILQGTSGAHRPEQRLNDLVIAERIVSLTNTTSPAKKPGEGTNPLEWEEFGVQAYSKKEDTINFANAFFCDPTLVALAKQVPYRDGTVWVGTVGCGDIWNREADLISFYHKTRGTDCEAMEGIAVAQVCEAFGVPMIEIRVISNNELHDEVHYSVETACCSQRFVMNFLKLL